ncbi:class I glutamine amidotransferase-like protein [Aspergillus alliaceus]|uniref:Class I glutamine amidotransferase-like protein n=1 Tax=Petromyces alliaceus TaxID=209559 RepID=A0A5N6FXW0_PETAA|nr:class I glutamine amidotransferase-like protein [Aspergillus alliaceus]KAB8234798.1 class I glutamine amidotransferase-like protein [Aspergillus alliaceus]KAE8387131.1 class I glutamine amidotransferase-like protein [Aspergillus alliaceus]
MPQLHPYKAAILLYPGVDILDFASPLEILSHVNNTTPTPQITLKTIARTTITAGTTTLTITPDLLLDDALPTLQDYDILIVPGAGPPVTDALLAQDPIAPEIDLVRRFAALPPKDGARVPRTLFSVCTGALLLGKAGVLKGVTVTTHYTALEELRGVCRGANGEGAVEPVVVHRLYVDGGLIGEDRNVRLITAGGITSGLEASFFLVKEVFGEGVRDEVCQVMEYRLRV